MRKGVKQKPKQREIPKEVRKREGSQKMSSGPLDLPFLALTLLLVAIGLIMVLSASYPSAYYDIEGVTNHRATYYFTKQAAFALMGIGCMFLVSKFDYQHWRRYAWVLLVVSFVLLLLVRVPGLGVTVNGATRWLKYPIRFQPSEVAKLGVILYFSARLSQRQEVVRKRYSARTLQGRILNFFQRIGLLELIPYGLILLVVVGLLYLEPHMSATILILVVGAAILFAAGISVGWFLLAGGAMAGLLTIIINATDYMTQRIQLWHNPWIEPLNGGYQAIQSLLAIGSGGLLGLGLGNSRQKFLYLPEEHNDFIFSVVCEELGYIGAVLILLLFALLIIRGYWLALHAKDRFGSLIIVGVTTLLAFQVFLNVAVVSNLFPVTGISLPFFSYGGTALMIQLAEMGIVLSVSRQIPAVKSN